jgi:hypothetical protein
MYFSELVTFVATPTTVRVVSDGGQGMGVLARVLRVDNLSAANNVFIQLSPDGSRFGAEIVLPSWDLFWIDYDHGVFIHSVRVRGTIGQQCNVYAAPGRLPEPIPMSPEPLETTPGPITRVTRLNGSGRSSR